MRKIFLLFALIIFASFASAETFFVNNEAFPQGGIINNSLNTSSDPLFQYQSIGIYNVWFKTNPTQGQVIKYQKNGYYINFQPMALNWRNDINQLQQINMVQSVTGIASGTTFSYPNVYGSGINLTYNLNKKELKETLVINSYSSLTAPQAYIISGGNPVLELNFIIDTNNNHIVINGADWDKQTDSKTSNEIYIKDDSGKTIYYLPKPYAQDNNGIVSYGKYFLKKSGQSLYISIIINQSWLANAAYPVIIDPTFVVDYTPIPGVYLINGTVATSPDSSFENTTDITAGVSDDNDSTYYVIRQSFQEAADIRMSWYARFDEASGTVAYDSSSYGNNGIYYNTPNLTVAGTVNTGVRFDGVNEFATFADGDSFSLNSSESMILCFAINSYGNGFANGKPIFDHRTGSNSGWEVRGGDDELQFITDRDGSGSKSHNMVYQFTDSNWHKVCLYSSLTQIISYVDGAHDKTTSTTQTGALTANLNVLYVGTDEGVSSFTNVGLDEACYIKGTSLNHSNIATVYNNTGVCAGVISNLTKGTGISSHWNQTYEPQYGWFLMVKKIGNGSSTGYAAPYINNDSINSSMVVSKIMDSTGWFNINVSSLVDYQTNILGLNHTKLRFYTDNPSTNPFLISELRLRREANDTQNPVIHNCWVDDSVIYDAQEATFYCNITDDIDIDYVYEVGVGANWIKNHDIYSYEYTCNAVGTDVVRTVSNVTAIDLLGNNVSYNPSLSTTCKRHCDYTGQGLWGVIKNFACEISSSFIDFMNTMRFSGGGETLIVYDVDNFTNMTVDYNSTVTIQNGSTVTIGG